MVKVIIPFLILFLGLFATFWAGRSGYFTRRRIKSIKRNSKLVLAAFLCALAGFAEVR